MTALFKKLNFKNQKEIVVINHPHSFENELKEISKHTLIKDIEAVSLVDFAISFVLSKEQIEETIKLIFPKLNGDAILWFCYPKGTSKKYKCNFNRDSGWESVGNFNLEGVRQIAIDDDWSALRFRKTEFIKTITRRKSFSLSKEGKRRTANN